MSRNTYAEELAAARLMLTGIKVNAERLSKRGIDQEFINQFEVAIDQATTLNSDMEFLMTQRKEKTVALQEQLTTLNKLNSTSRRLVKIDYPQESWRQFGIMDQR